MTTMRSTLVATFQRELAEQRLNRFLHVHLLLSAAVSVLPLFTPDAADRAAPAWIVPAVLYCLSLSSLLLGLSAAQGDSDEFPLLFTQPIGRAAWLAGKVAAMATMLVPTSLLLVTPAALTSGLSFPLLVLALSAAGVCLALALLGLAIGCWVHDHVRGLLLALGVWFTLLFGTDLVLLALSGAPAVQQWPAAWLAPLMLNPLSALRVTMVFSLEQTAPAGIGTGALAGWWLDHGALWLGVLLTSWMLAAFGAGVAGAQRRLDA